MERFQSAKSGNKSKIEKRAKAAKNAIPHVPTIWCRKKTSTAFDRSAAAFFETGFRSLDGKRVESTPSDKASVVRVVAVA